MARKKTSLLENKLDQTLINHLQNDEARAIAKNRSRQEIIEKVESMEISLNGKRAIIGGYKNDFLEVAQIPSGLRAEYSDQAIAYVLWNKNGKFIY